MQPHRRLGSQRHRRRRVGAQLLDAHEREPVQVLSGGCMYVSGVPDRPGPHRYDDDSTGEPRQQILIRDIIEVIGLLVRFQGERFGV